MAEYNRNEIEKKQSDYGFSAHHYSAIIYLFRVVIELVKRVDDIERGIPPRIHNEYYGRL